MLQVTDCCPIENVQEIWSTKKDFDRPNSEIGWKMANGQLLFLALHVPIDNKMDSCTII